MKTHKLVDLISTADDVIFYGTERECYEEKAEHGYGYKIVELSESERLWANSTNIIPFDDCCLLIERITYIDRLQTPEKKAKRLIELVKATGFELSFKGHILN